MLDDRSLDMNHELSIKMQAADKYLLGELSPSEREAFEQHFFECPECAEEIRLGFYFKDNANAVFREEAQPAYRPVRSAKPRDWFAWMRPMVMAPVAVCLVLALFSGYQSAVTIPALRARVGQLERPRVLTSNVVLAPSSRASVPSIAVSSDEQFFLLSLAVVAARPAERYQCDLRSESGRTIWTLPVPRLDPDTNLSLLIPASEVPAGYYDAVILAVTGRDVTELDRYHFMVRRQ